MIYFCLDKEKIKYVSGIAEHELLMTDDNNADDDAMANSILHTLKRIYWYTRNQLHVGDWLNINYNLLHCKQSIMRLGIAAALTKY